MISFKNKSVFVIRDEVASLIFMFWMVIMSFVWRKQKIIIVNVCGDKLKNLMNCIIQTL